MLPLVARRTLAVAEDARGMAGVLFRTVILPSEDPAVRAGSTAGANYSKEAKGKKPEEHQLGPPHVRIMVAVMENLLEEKAVGVTDNGGVQGRLSAEVRTPLKKAWTDHNAPSDDPDQLQNALRYFRMGRT